jgi:hypothetical protein
VKRKNRYSKKWYVMSSLINAWNRLCDWIFEKNVVFIKYENLVGNPHSSKTIISEIGLEMEERVTCPVGTPGYGDSRAMQGGKIDESSIGSYRRSINGEVARFIVAQCRDNMKRLNYI